MVIQQPFELIGKQGQFDVFVNVRGGGLSGQAGAVKHGIAKALLEYNDEYRTILKRAGMLTRDSRVKERKKYGQPGQENGSNTPTVTSGGTTAPFSRCNVIRVAIYGASGYTGQELIRLLARHPQCELAAITSRRYAGMKVTDIYPHLRGYTDLSFADSDPAELASQCQVVFLALPHGVSMTVAETFLDAGVKVIDLSADFRIRKAPVYKSWYQEHKAPHLLPRAVYGLPELYRDEIRTASLIANPGCYPTSIILGLAPLLGEDWVDPTALIADSKSGTSGAGREPLVTSLFCEVNESFKAYKIGGTHRHIPEIEQELSALAGQELTITFSPHLLPVTRGILSTLYAPLVEDRNFRKSLTFTMIFIVTNRLSVSIPRDSSPPFLPFGGPITVISGLPLISDPAGSLSCRLLTISSKGLQDRPFKT